MTPLSFQPPHTQIHEGSLQGQMLIAMPGMGDPHFARTLVYICAHSTEGTMGIIINQPISHLSLFDLLNRLNIIDEDTARALPESFASLQILRGGPVEPQRGFVLHSADYSAERTTLPINDLVSLTVTVDILDEIARGQGPKQALLALGYAGWSAGQLEEEILKNQWLTCMTDLDLLFGVDPNSKHMRALQKLGIEGAALSTEAGHA